MGEQRPIMRAADVRRTVKELVGMGCAVTLAPDGTIHVSPPQPGPKPDAIDLIDFRR